MVEFTIRGKQLSLTREQVIRALKKASPGLIRLHTVEIGGVKYSVKKAFAQVTGLDLLEFQTAEARRVFERLGFKVGRKESQNDIRD